MDHKYNSLYLLLGEALGGHLRFGWILSGPKLPRVAPRFVGRVRERRKCFERMKNVCAFHGLFFEPGMLQYGLDTCPLLRIILQDTSHQIR